MPPFLPLFAAVLSSDRRESEQTLVVVVSVLKSLSTLHAFSKVERSLRHACGVGVGGGSADLSSRVFRTTSITQLSVFIACFEYEASSFTRETGGCGVEKYTATVFVI